MIVDIKSLFGDFAEQARAPADLRAQIRAALAAGERVDLDFEGVHAIVSSLIEDLMPPLHDEADVAAVDRLLIVRNASPAIEAVFAVVRDIARRNVRPRPSLRVVRSGDTE